MTESVIKCRILVGKNGTRAQAAVNQAAESYGAVFVEPDKFFCDDCRTEYSGCITSTGGDLKIVSCSNCYGDNVYLTALRISVPEDWEVSGGEDPKAVKA
jgi:hypothetical protein